MLIAIIVVLACESAVSLPPVARDPARVAPQMVAAGEVRGYLVRAAGSSDGVLMLTADLGEATRARAASFSDSTVLAITPTSDLDKSRAYLRGLPGIERVSVICVRDRCPEINPGAERSSQQDH